jgi:hypothetical protein
MSRVSTEQEVVQGKTQTNRVRLVLDCTCHDQRECITESRGSNFLEEKTLSVTLITDIDLDAIFGYTYTILRLRISFARPHPQAPTWINVAQRSIDAPLSLNFLTA